jgi:hypothetical protein
MEDKKVYMDELRACVAIVWNTFSEFNNIDVPTKEDFSKAFNTLSTLVDMHSKSPCGRYISDYALATLDEIQRLYVQRRNFIDKEM